MSQLILPDDDLAPAPLALARETRAFAEDKLLPHARRIDEEGVFRKESVRELADAGILGGPIAKAAGGGGWSALQLAVAHEEIGAVCNNTRGFLAVQSCLVAGGLARSGDERQKSRWLAPLIRGTAIGSFGLTEEEAGSDVAALQCRAMPAANGYELTGTKIWNTNGGVASLAIVFATVDPARGKDGICAFLVELDGARGLTRAPMPGKDLGHRGSSHAQLVFDRTPVPGDAVLGGVGKGFEVAMGALQHGRLSVAAGAVGIHRAALAASIAFVRQRKQFGKPLAAFQMVQERIADMTVALLAARQLVHRCARRRDEGHETIADLAAAKLFATEAASRACDEAVMLHGGRGYSSAYPVERLLRDSIGLRIYEGTTLIQKSILARELLR